MEESILIYPGDPEFEGILGTVLPLDWRKTAWQFCGDFNFIVDSQSGLMRVANFEETREYLEGGEYDERLNNIGDSEEWVH
ncbi:hypothetical protein NDI44_08665 [Trichocoleus sp. DQ-A3]|uniref:hypothetical protein n=1 Tax=Cyanophyceae TaxID=3028117 RepID=UPI0016870B37|nr:hypothetical protein [Coleofasciculus sp. FACHB-125]MBD1899263.1 hypothetical protein [Coleofasciculus sp. FACHB-125]